MSSRTTGGQALSRMRFFMWMEDARERWKVDHTEALHAFDAEDELRPVGKELVEIFQMLEQLDRESVGIDDPEERRDHLDFLDPVSRRLLPHFERLVRRWNEARKGNPRMDDVPPAWIEAQDLLKAALEEDDDWLDRPGCRQALRSALKVDPGKLKDYP